MRTDGDFLKLELTDLRILYIARNEITRIIFDPLANGFTLFTSHDDFEPDSTGETFLEQSEPKAYKTIKTYLALKS